MKQNERTAIRRLLKQVEDILLADEERNRTQPVQREKRIQYLAAARIARAEKKKKAAAVDPVAKRKAELWAELEALESNKTGPE